MLNGDVLTDIDLTAQLDAARAHGRARDARADRRSRTRRRTGSCACDDGRLGDASSSRSRAPSRARHQPDQRRRLHPRARACSTAWPPAGTNVSIERDVFPTLVGHGLYGYEASGYWLDIGTPDRYLQATFDILEGKVSTEVGRAARASRADAGRRRDASRAGSSRRRWSAPAATVAARAIVGGRERARRGRDRRRGRAHRVLGAARRGAASAPPRRSARSIVGPGVQIGEHCHIEGGVVLGEGVADRVGEHACGRRAYLPGRGATRRSDQVLSTTTGSDPRKRSRRSTSRGMVDDILGDARASARRAVAGRVGEPRARGRSRRAGRGRNGRLGDRRRAGPGGARGSRLAPDRDRARATRSRRGRRPTRRCCAAATRATPRRRSRSTRRPARSARGRSSPPRAASSAEAARAEGVPVIPLPGGFQPRAAVAYSLVVALEVAWLCGAGERLHAEIDVAAAHARADRRRCGARTRPRIRWPRQLARGLHGTIPQIAGAGLTSPIAYRWKTQINENAKMPASPMSCPSSITTRSSGGRAPGSSDRFSAVFLDDSDLHPRIRQRIELTRGLIEADAAGTYRVETIGQNRTERLSRSCCWATWCRSTSRCCARSIRRRCRRSSA